METIYNKLIRDNIPGIIEEEGRLPVFRILEDDEYLDALNKKLLEEINEYQESNNLDELCDIIEVVFAIAKTKGFSTEEISISCDSKNTKNGAFEKRLFLEKVITREVI